MVLALKARLIVCVLIGLTSICLSDATETDREAITFELDPIRNETIREECFKENIDPSLNASTGMDIDDEEYVDRLINLIRFQPFNFDTFHPWEVKLHEQEERYSDINCFRRLYGVLYMRKRRVTRFDQRWPEYVGIKVDIEYPKLCVKCEDLVDFHFDIDASEREETNRTASFINVCARYVRGVLKVLRPKYINDRSYLLSHDIDKNTVKFDLDFAGNTREVNVKAKEVWCNLKVLLPWINRAVTTYLTSDRFKEHYLNNIGVMINDAGICWMGNCSALEVMSDFELVDRVAIALKRRLKSVDPKYVTHTIPVNSSEHEMVLREFQGLSKVQIVGYYKIEIARKYRLDVFLRYPEICIIADLRPIRDPKNVVSMLTCKKNFLTYFSIYFENGQITVSNFEEMRFDVPSFRLLTGNVSMIPLSSRNEYGDPTLLDKCHFVYYIYEDLLIDVKSVLQDFRRCSFGECFLVPWIQYPPVWPEVLGYHPTELLDLFGNTISLSTTI